MHESDNTDIPNMNKTCTLEIIVNNVYKDIKLTHTRKLSSQHNG